NVDGSATITNHGLISGNAFQSGDADGVDVDSAIVLDNYGRIEGNGSDGVAMGGGVVNNYAGAEIYGVSYGILVDNSDGGAAFAATTIVNAGTIEGASGEAINIVGNFADTLSNSGTIIGGVSMGGGDDVLTNSGTMTATGGSAIDMGAGDDTVTML